MANEFVFAGTPWVVYKPCKSGKTLAKAFKHFRDAVDYIIINQEQLGCRADEDFLPNSIEFIKD